MRHNKLIFCRGVNSNQIYCGTPKFPLPLKSASSARASVCHAVQILSSISPSPTIPVTDCCPWLPTIQARSMGLVKSMSSRLAYQSCSTPWRHPLDLAFAPFGFPLFGFVPRIFRSTFVAGCVTDQDAGSNKFSLCGPSRPHPRRRRLRLLPGP